MHGPSRLASHASFLHVYAEQLPFVRRLARRLLPNPADAEELVQDVFLQVWNQYDSFDPQRATLRTWLGVITRSRGLDRLRRQCIRQRHETGRADFDDDCADGPDPWSGAELAGMAARLRAQLEDLESPARRILELTYRCDLSQRQVACEIGETLGTVKWRLHQALGTLRTSLARDASGSRTVDNAPVEHALTVEDNDALRAVPGRPPMRSLSGLTVLVVDDHQPSRDMLGAVLGRVGAVAMLSGCTADACRQLDEVWPDVLLADISMPVEDGYVLIGRVAALEARRGAVLPAIALTGLESELDRQRLLASGFRAHLSKPVHPSVVVDRILDVSRARPQACAEAC